jgi:nitric oxide reductase NorD protein
MSSLPPSSERPPTPALSADEVAARLAETLDAVLSSRRTPREAAFDIAALDRPAQDFILHWTHVIARTSAELAFQLAIAAPPAVRTLGREAAERWVVRAIDAYDRDGLYAGTEALRDLTSFAEGDDGATVTFEDAAPVLRLFVQGLTGRSLTIEPAARAWTDTERIYLPPRIDTGRTRRENFLRYKAAAAMLWAQNRYGTFNADIEAEIARYDEPDRALALFTAIETRRLEARLARALPGLARDIAALSGDIEADPRLERLEVNTASVHDSLALLRELYESAASLPARHGIAIDPALARQLRDARIAHEKAQLEHELARIAQAQEDARGEGAPAFALEKAGRESDAGSSYTLTLDGKPVAVPNAVAALIESIEQDLGDIPADYLTTSRADLDEAQEPYAPAEPQPAYSYDEWDYQRGHYRKDWCEVRERAVEPTDSGFVEATLRKYGGRIAQLKRTFELMRGEDRVMKREPEGDDVDYDALVDAYVDMAHGSELATRVFAKRKRAERDLAALFMVDMSGSTKGWINDVEREALVMLCEALEALGDRYAIYGFSGMTRKQCEIFRIKRFDESYDDAVRARIGGIEAQDYTRMGAAIRHLTSRLNAVDARTRLLVTLSDGRPDDFSDNYRGTYGIEDTRQALLEAQRSGVKPFCITIDREARDYLPHMYGAASWTLVQDVASLPVKLAQTYARLTR